ncbi:hypothetical protein Pint_31826 [Pistacia integerrima]|uniref:Uncharacterized protein n=1 Tax=Pistacia integerrima TaxID=434235 RepID=A0ACC0XPR0_9ROSI|nr:hypothetical protein Pint_31826 [Pistacia integerrima]
MNSTFHALPQLLDMLRKSKGKILFNIMASGNGGSLSFSWIVRRLLWLCIVDLDFLHFILSRCAGCNLFMQFPGVLGSMYRVVCA